MKGACGTLPRAQLSTALPIPVGRPTPACPSHRQVVEAVERDRRRLQSEAGLTVLGVHTSVVSAALGGANVWGPGSVRAFDPDWVAPPPAAAGPAAGRKGLSRAWLVRVSRARCCGSSCAASLERALLCCARVGCAMAPDGASLRLYCGSVGSTRDRCCPGGAQALRRGRRS